MRNIGIASPKLRQIRSLFKKYPAITKGILFGSRAKGNFRAGSDIDLALQGKGLNNRLIVQLEVDYEKLYLPWKLGLVIYKSIQNKELKNHIDRRGLLLYRKT